MSGVTYVIVGLCLAAVCLGIWSVLIEPRLLAVREIVVAREDGPCQPVRVAVAGDIHAGAPHVGLDRLSKIVDRINAGKPDLVFLLGDYVVHRVVGGTRIAPELIATELGRLAPSLGVVSVLGNHDWWLDGNRVRAALSQEGIAVLENDALRKDLPCGSFWVVGLADDSTRQALPERALEPVPDGDPVVVIAHDPANFPETPARFLIYLAGHTHGGQVFLPIIGAPFIPGRAPRRHAYGLIRENGRQMYVTSGIGTSILPLRFNMLPEIVFLTIQRTER